MLYEKNEWMHEKYFRFWPRNMKDRPHCKKTKQNKTKQNKTKQRNNNNSNNNNNNNNNNQ